MSSFNCFFQIFSIAGLFFFSCSTHGMECDLSWIVCQSELCISSVVETAETSYVIVREKRDHFAVKLFSV